MLLTVSRSKAKRFSFPLLEMNKLHNCTPDDNGYPLYPNCQTVFVKTPNMMVHNFGFVGFTKTSKVEGQVDRSDFPALGL
jgi:hypothetical protein